MSIAIFISLNCIVVSIIINCVHDKLMSEIEYFAASIDPDWQSVYSTLSGYIKAKKTATE